jgi:choline dehydrogenase-like flavoprotein
MSAHPSELVLSPSESRALLALTRAALPPGKILAGGDARTAAQARLALAILPAGAQRAYRGLLQAFSLGCRASTGRAPDQLSPARLQHLLRRSASAGFARRSGLRLLLAPLKAAHFSNPELYARLGCTFLHENRAEPAPRAQTERCHDAADLDEDLHLEVDVVVVGSGAGGAAAAAELARSGLAVAIIEEGDYFKRHQFTGRPFAMQRLLYRDFGATMALGNAAIPVPIGKTVGGTTTVNSGTCYRPPARVLEEWRRLHGLSDMTEEALSPYFEEVESVLQVQRAESRYLGGVARVIARGCDRLGLDKHGALLRNAPACDGQGVCAFGCPTDAKRSTNVSYVPRALRAGAELFYKARVEEILFESDRASGVRARSTTGRKLVFEARAVVLACGALLTPLLLQAQNLAGRSGQLGANLTIHPAQGVMARFDERIASYAAIPQGYGIEDLHDRGLLFEGASTPLDLTMAALPLVGDELVELAENFDQLAIFGFMIEDKCTGRVRSVAGKPVIHYHLGRREVELLRQGVELLCRIYFAAGARRVYPMVHGFERFDSVGEIQGLRKARLRARDFELSAYHPLGSARMGASPGTSVVDPNGRVHDAEGIYVMDGSCVPSSPAVNPQVTIMALATRNARRLAERLS